MLSIEPIVIVLRY